MSLNSIKGHISVTNLRKMTGNHLNLDLVNINANTMFSQIKSIYFKTNEQNEIMEEIWIITLLQMRNKMTRYCQFKI